MHISVPVSVILLVSAALPAVALPPAGRPDTVIARRAPSATFVEIEQRSPQLQFLFKGIAKGVEKVRSLASIVKSGVEYECFSRQLVEHVAKKKISSSATKAAHKAADHASQSQNQNQNQNQKPPKQQKGKKGKRDLEVPQDERAQLLKLRKKASSAG